MFEKEDICKGMHVVTHGIVEISAMFDKQKVVMERLGRGSVINSFNFLVEEEMQVTASIDT